MKIISWMQKHTFETHTLAFLLMILPPIPLYWAAQQGATGWVWFLLVPVILGNLLVLLVK